MKQQIKKFKCKRCEHSWFPRSNKYPTTCPKCKSPYWNKPKTRFTEKEKKSKQ